MAIQVTVLPEELACAFDREPAQLYGTFTYLVGGLASADELRDFLGHFVPESGALQHVDDRKEARDVAAVLRKMADALDVAAHQEGGK